MTMAHERDMTFNEFIEEALLHAIEETKAGRLTKEKAEEILEDSYSDI
jgi:DNA-binding transcriptional regulator YhcF (GntR family)